MSIYEKGDIIIYEYLHDLYKARIKEVDENYVKAKNVGVFGRTRILPISKIQSKQETDNVWIYVSLTDHKKYYKGEMK